MSGIRPEEETAADADGRNVYPRHQRRRDWDMLILAVLAVGAAFALQVEHSRVRLNFWPGLLLPETCPTKICLDLECPGCGLTRSFLHLVRGDFAASVQANRVGWLVAIMVLLQIPYRLWAIQTRGRIFSPRYRAATGWLVVILLISNWVYGFWA